MKTSACVLRSMTQEDVPAYGRMLKRAFNTWYWNHGWGQDYFQCDERELGIFWDIYRQISPGHCFVAVEPDSGALMGACFYHPREHHVTLGIMAVEPDHFRRGVGKQLVNRIIEFTESHGYAALRLVGSACNMNSFSLYNRAGFVPRVTYQDMVVRVPASGLEQSSPLDARVRGASVTDVAAIKSLELEISGICREGDYRFCIDNPVGCLHASVLDANGAGLSGFAASVRHPALHMIGPAFARTEPEMLALLLKELDRFRGEAVLVAIPMDRRQLVETLYRCGAVNVETHLFQVRGKFQPFQGVNLPSFLPETG
ncbi:MAG: GNAT family N-acetyltransferase [Verrucomicrobia bacterium]|nr:GNAT family N-acetyltransferase [Verrucomicrobiota bacterium]